MRDDQEVAEGPEATGTREDVFPFEGGGRETPSGGPGGEQTEEKSGGETEKQSEGENFGVDADVEIDGDGDGEAKGGEAIRGPERDENAEEAAEE